MAVSFPKLCPPALLYLVLGALSLAYMATILPFSANLIKLLFILVWTWFLNFLCLKGYSIVSWVLVLLPFIFIVVMFILAFTLADTTTVVVVEDDNAKQQ